MSVKHYDWSAYNAYVRPNKIAIRDLTSNKTLTYRIVEEPNGGAHRDFEASANALKSALIDELDELSKVKPNEFLENRIQKYDTFGYFEENT